MLFKTITLELLQQHLQRHIAMPMLDRYSADLQASHQAWLNLLSQQSPDSSPSQLSSEALELAIDNLKQRLREDFPQQDSQPDSPLNLDAAMAFLHRHKPRT